MDNNNHQQTSNSSKRGNIRGSWRGRGRFFPRRGSSFRGSSRSNSSIFGNVISPAIQHSPSSSQGTSSQVLTDFFDVVPSPYRGWKQYHPHEGYVAGSPTEGKVKAMENFIKKNLTSYSAPDIVQRKAFSIDLKVLMADSDFMEAWPLFHENLTDLPEHSLNCLGLAMHQIVILEIENKLKERTDEGGDNNAPSINVPIIRARIKNFEPVVQLKHLKANYYGKLVAVHGTIIRVGNAKLLCTWMAFECSLCDTMQCVKQPEGVYTLPVKCRTGACRSKMFIPLHSSPFTQTVNWQSVRLQELVADDQREGGRVPRTIDCEVTEDLLDLCVPGDVVTVIGIIKVQNNQDKMKKNAPNMFLLYIDAVSIVNNKSSNTISERKVGTGFKLDAKDCYAIREIRSQPRLFRLLVNSLCPTIYGHELVKAGLLLALFGGSQHGTDSRADPHVLVVGDPGLGKSQMLQACSSIAPRGVYVCGNTSTSSGLTVTLSKEPGGDYALEAGALVLADQGCCCIDEFDKMSGQHSALLEAMEQQSISIAKAGIVCSLPARTSILAAANPVGGHYNRAKTVSENLRIGSALLSRFDLVFILLDRPNEHLDTLLSEHVMALHSGLMKKLESEPGHSAETLFGNQDEPDLNRPLSERLKKNPSEVLDPVPHQLLRKYVAYARKYVQPKLSVGATEILQKFYLTLRRRHDSMDCTPITTRQLESMIRLTEARAKLELREKVTELDALDVVEIMRYSLVDTLSDGFGGLDFQRSQNGSGMSNKNQGKRFIAALQRRAELQNRSLFSVPELKELASIAGIQVTDFHGFLSTLNIQGYLLKKGPQLFQLLTADY